MGLSLCALEELLPVIPDTSPSTLECTKLLGQDTALDWKVTQFGHYWFASQLEGPASGFLAQAKGMLVRLTGVSKLGLGVNMSVTGCLCGWVLAL